MRGQEGNLGFQSRLDGGTEDDFQGESSIWRYPMARFDMKLLPWHLSDRREK
jgi:hypothetical protein